MPNRIIKESICESRGLSEASVFADDLYKRLLTYADDYGRFNADSQIILARLYPREMHIVTIEDIEDALVELIGVGKIQFYTSNVKKELYGCFPNWGEHQRIRESKKRNPEPDDTTVNDYYLRRFVSIDLKRRIIERDRFVCQECGKQICSPAITADRLIKMGTGLFHIDHIVPVIQGGRATEENLRLLCPTCNLTRKRRFTFEEICRMSNASAKKCGENLQISALIQSNPIQYESNPNPYTKGLIYRPNIDDVKEFISVKNYHFTAEEFMNYYDSVGWMQNGSPITNWQKKCPAFERNAIKAKPHQTVPLPQHFQNRQSADRGKIDYSTLPGRKKNDN